MRKCLLLVAVITIAGCTNKKNTTATNTPWLENYQAITITGDTLYSKAPSQKIIDQYTTKKQAFEASPDLENTIWYGRFTAYTGNYRGAIAIYSDALKKFPNESRLLRHRGHRYITVREFGNAITDLEKAASLIKDQENKVEEDGMPNAQNIPVSTMHGNIYYHLGLAYYFNGDDNKAVQAFKKCLKTSKNPDNVVSATHWIYTINCQMGRIATGDNYVKNITSDMNVIENDAYHKACLLYKGELQTEDLLGKQGNEAAGSALKYGIGNYLLCTRQSGRAETIFTEIVAGEDWASFGYIAAEIDLKKKFN